MKERQNKNIIFLNLIYQNAQMGLIDIDTVIKKLEDSHLAKLVEEQRKEYEKFLKDAKGILIKYGAKEEEISKLPYIFKDQIKIERKIDPREKNFGSKI